MAQTPLWQSVTDTVKPKDKQITRWLFFFFHLNLCCPWCMLVSSTSYQKIATVLPVCLRRVGLHTVFRSICSQHISMSYKIRTFYLLYLLCCVFRNISAIPNWYIWGLHLWNWTKTWDLQDSQVWKTTCGFSVFGSGKAYKCFHLPSLQTARG